MSLQILLLFAGPRILVHMPFRVSTLILQSAAPYFEQSHCHPRPYFRKLDAFIPCSYENMMSNFYIVLNVFEGHDSISHFLICCCGIPRREEMLDYLGYPFAQRSVEVFE